MLSASKSSGPSGYNISRSVRLRSSASAYFNRTPTTSNRKTYTYSAWVKRGSLTQGMLFDAGEVVTPYLTRLYFLSDNTLQFVNYNSTATINRITTQVFRDPSAWYHIVCAVDTTQATASDRVKLYVNGQQITSFSTNTTTIAQNTDTAINYASYVFYMGRNLNTGDYFDGYLTEINFIDGQALTPSSFGSTNATTGVWQPAKYTGTYGTNGFYLNFSDNSAATAAAIGKDYSGNGNNWTPNNISVTAGVTYDSMIDVPTPYADGSTGRGNYAVLNPLNKSGSTAISNGNLYAAATTNAVNAAVSSIACPANIQSYWEVTISSAGDAYRLETGMATNAWTFAAALTASTPTLAVQQNAGNTTLFVYVNTTSVFSVANVLSVNDVYMFAYDDATNKVWVGKNGTWFNSGVPASGTGNVGTLSSGNVYFPCAQLNTAAGTNAVYFNFGQRPFSYTPPSGFKALNTYNLPASTITNGAKYMAATTYTGNGSTLSIVNAGSFKPDLYWAKSRSSANNNIVYDSVRGVQKYLSTNLTNAEGTASGVTSFNSNGVTVGSDPDSNANATTYVGWQWQAGQGTTSSNTSGSITSTVSVNATAGFSIVTYTGTGANATVGHGLGVAPKMIICKSRSNAYNWVVYHASIGNTQNLKLNLTDAATVASTSWNNTSPTSSVFSLGSSLLGNDTGSMVAYCWSEIAGFSKFGSYTGNGSTDGPFVYCGFRPRWVLIKRTDAIADWVILDTARDSYNMAINYLVPNTSGAETAGSSVQLDLLANGFKIRGTWQGMNASGGTYIYAAFAENPFANALAR